MGRRNPLTDWAQFFLGERYPWPNQACQIWWRSLKGFRGSCGSNFSISHWLCWSSLQHSHTTVWACDPHGWGFPRMYCLIPLVRPLYGTIISSTEFSSSGNTFKQFYRRASNQGLSFHRLSPAFISSVMLKLSTKWKTVISFWNLFRAMLSAIVE